MKKIILLLLGILCILLVLLNPSEQKTRNEFYKVLTANNYNAIDAYDQSERLEINNYMFFSTLIFKNKNIGYAFLDKVIVNNLD